ncbi:hypothetical protein IFR09_19975 [Pseudomonas syringae]|nr:hypothetical protein [Pseudomonas syringae]MBD8574346.1 hypothetical protein [Pseudomonas syringae]MBD8791979.1 hypothetical protein [Pseudomonas syringae]MBD8801203.1 hypothetical protein [Pseudomonas syringae]MBD8813444.1 hypothetical protein [Pseudomonas syringae]
MSSQPDSTLPATTLTATPALLVEAIEQAHRAERELQLRSKKLTKGFMIVQAIFCGYWMLKWIWQGHYIGGPIYAVLIWFFSWLLYAPVPLLWHSQKRAVARAWERVDQARMEAGRLFLEEQALGPYRWICRNGRMLGVFPDSQVLYALVPELDNRHALMDAPQVVRQVLVNEQVTSSSTTHTTTEHGERNLYGANGSFGVLGKGKSHSTSTTTSTTAHNFTLSVQLQGANYEPYWIQLPFGEDWQEARNWQLLIEQTAGR